MNITHNWINLMPNMISLSRRAGTRIPEFEPFLIQNPESAAQYANFVIKASWPEAEDSISTDANASYNYALNSIRARWEKGENVISTNPQLSLSYAINVLKGPFALGEPSIASNSTTAHAYAFRVLKSRFIAGEPAIAATETNGNTIEFVRAYYDAFMQNPDSWKTWTEDQLKICPCWMYMYAKDHLKGRLPDLLHNHMMAFGMTLKDDYYVKKYFKAKRYQKKVKYRRKKKFSTISEEINSTTEGV